ncbi:hypothetical protein [Francisella sp. SYW-9]|uniref:hypothetical protein n=1 Tax=Francisella sp. SYW-9 TaxID=2610888 RepID=UPI00123D0C17|nr:hypothetical protein [Francisella sp. SYW-9]
MNKISTKESMYKFYNAFSDPNYSSEKIIEECVADNFMMYTNNKTLNQQDFYQHMKFIRSNIRVAISIEHLIVEDNYTYDIHSAFGFTKDDTPVHLKYIAKTFFNEDGKMERIESMSYPITGDMSHINISTNLVKTK